MRLVVMLVICCAIVTAEPVFHTFELWGIGNDTSKLYLYYGWTNGFLQGMGPNGIRLANCLGGVTTKQAVAMIEKHYKNHPEKWSRMFGEQILEALTIEGGPCEGTNPFANK